MSSYVVHHSPKYWENPEGFDPDRFTEARSKDRPSFAYFPFGSGPRLCIGSSFAMMEAELVLATVAQKFRLDLVPSHPVEPEPLITLRQKYGLKMTLQRLRISTARIQRISYAKQIAKFHERVEPVEKSSILKYNFPVCNK